MNVQKHKEWGILKYRSLISAQGDSRITVKHKNYSNTIKQSMTNIFKEMVRRRVEEILLTMPFHFYKPSDKVSLKKATFGCKR